MAKNKIVGVLVLLFSLIAAYILIILSVYSALTTNREVISTDILGESYIYKSENWFAFKYFLKFNAPGGKHYYISNVDGIIEREREIVAEDLGDKNDNVTVPKTYNQYEEKTSIFFSNTPYISFVSLNYKLYDIYFEFNGIPYIRENRNITENAIPTFVLIRHRLHCFVGPNKNVYRILYNNGNISDIAIAETNPVQYLDHFQIKTFGPYAKWEHTYEFSSNGLQVTSHIITPVEIVPNRSIPLLEVTPNSEWMDQTYLIFNTPSGKKYVVMNDLNIVSFNDDYGLETSPFISYIGPNGAIYNINFSIDERGYHATVENAGIVEQYYGWSRLLSFVGPNHKLYSINCTYENATDIPILVAVPDNQIHKDLKINVSKPDDYKKYFNKEVAYTFRDDGKHLIDREDGFDFMPMYEQPDYDLEEVDSDSEVIITSFLSFYSPSGKNYHVTTTNESEANIVIEKGLHNNRPSHIQFMEANGKINRIYFSSHDDPFIMEDGYATKPISTPNNTSPPFPHQDPYVAGGDFVRRTSPFYLNSFVTPYKKLYFVYSSRDNMTIVKPSDQEHRQPIDPIDERLEKCLSISIQNTQTTYIFEFSWSGDKFLNVYAKPRLVPFFDLPTYVGQSLIGGGNLDEKYLKQQRRQWYKKKSSKKN